MITALQNAFVEEFTALDDYLKTQFSAFEPELQPYLPDLLRLQGKKLRATLLFLSADIQNNNRQAILKAAAIIEMIHYATLIHDDVLDAAVLRQNQPTLSAKHGPVVAILLGDALFAHALTLASEFPTTHVCHLVSQATRQVCTGEIMQTFHREGEYIPLKTYHRIIELKTAALFGAATELGAYFSGHPEDLSQSAKAFGQLLGIAYQIYDDTLDYFGTSQTSGKTLGTDLISGKWTLPLILLKEQLTEKEQLSLCEGMLQQTLTLEGIRKDCKHYGVLKTLTHIFDDTLSEAKSHLLKFKGLPMSQALETIMQGLEALWISQIKTNF